MKKLAVSFLFMIFVLLAASCSNKNDSSKDPSSNEAIDIFDLNSITAFLELNKEDITILSEEDDLLTFAIALHEDVNVYVTKLEGIGFSLRNDGALVASISATYILEDGDNTAAITSISNSYMDLYKEAHSNDIEGVEKLTEENMLFQFTKGDIVYDGAEHDDGTGAAADIPELHLSFALDGAINTIVPVAAGTASWTYDNGDGTATGVEQCGMHPLDSIGYIPEIKKTSDLKSLEIAFTNTPESYRIRRWSDEYAGNAEAYEAYYETVAAENGIIVLPDDGQGYIYEVYAKWANGSAYYGFYITAKSIVVEGTETVYDIVNDLDGVTLEIKEETLSTTGLVIIMRNNSENECTFGSFYCLEIKADDIWYQLPYIVDDNVGWNDIAYPVGENDEKELEVNWEWLYGKLDAGEYRIVKDTFNDNIWETKYYVATEFTIK